MTRVRIPGGQQRKCDWPTCGLKMPPGDTWKLGPATRDRLHREQREWWVLETRAARKDYCPAHGIKINTVIELGARMELAKITPEQLARAELEGKQ